MARPVIAAISFLNTAPLMWDFEQGELGRQFDLTYTIPSACTEALRAGVADVGLIPAVAYHGIPGLRIIPEVCISARGPVQTILLVSKVPIEEIRTVAADTASRSSVALLRVLFREWYGGPRQFTAMDPYLPLMLDRHDAALIIGDPAFHIDRSRYFSYDLSELWTQKTGRPFVFAFWTVREAAMGKIPQGLDLAQTFQASRDHGLANVEQIALKWVARLPLSKADICNYLTSSIDYVLDKPKLEGMRLFLDLALTHGVLTNVQPLDFLQPQHPPLLRHVNHA